ncbi:Helix-loop-helix DNA-binding domain-containing protein [Cladophialophora immunda]|nr:Helix-loop-helix DNA-binding domain-containing protein [Cladophialophora immunda]
MDFQDPSVFDQESRQCQDETYIIGVINDLNNAWTVPTETQQPQNFQPRSYARGSYLDAQFSPCLEPCECPAVETIEPAQLHLNGSDFSMNFEACQSPEEFSSLGPKDEGCGLSPLSSPGSADGQTSSRTQKCVSRAHNARSSESGSGPRSKKGRPRKKRNQSTSSRHAHSVTERRYRENLNGKMMQLHQVLEAAKINHPSRAAQINGSSLGPNLSGRVRKPDIMSRAINYIHQSEVEIRHLDDEIKRLQGQVCMFQKLFSCDGCSLLKDVA